MTTLADRIKSARRAAGMSQADLAGDDMASSFVCLVETGRRKPSKETLGVIAARLRTTPDILLHGPDAPAERRASQAVAAAREELTSGKPAQARDRLVDAELERASLPVKIEGLRSLATAHDILGDGQAVVDVLEPLLDVVITADLLSVAAEVGMSLVAAKLELGLPDAAIALGNRVLATVEDAGLAGTDEHVRLAATLVWAYFERGDRAHAQYRIDRLIDLVEECGSLKARGSVYWNAGFVSERRGDVTRGTMMLRRALDLLTVDGGVRDVPRLQLEYGSMLMRMPDPDGIEALAQLRKAEHGLRSIGSANDVGRCLTEQGRAQLSLGRDTQAQQAVNEALTILGDGATPDVCTAHIVLGDLAAFRGDHATAEAEYLWAADRLAMMSITSDVAQALADVGARLAAEGDHVRAIRLLTRAADEARITPSSPANTAPTAAAQDALRRSAVPA